MASASQVSEFHALSTDPSFSYVPGVFGKEVTLLLLPKADFRDPIKLQDPRCALCIYLKKSASQRRGRSRLLDQPALPILLSKPAWQGLLISCPDGIERNFKNLMGMPKLAFLLVTTPLTYYLFST